MKLHIITIGKPRLEYAKAGWEEYFSRLQRLHQVRVTHITDKYANDAAKISEVQGTSYRVVLEISGKQFSSENLAEELKRLEIMGKEISFMVGGPEGLPTNVRQNADLLWSLGSLTLPHDLAMVTLLEAVYRASTINAGLPYHK